MGKAKKRSFHLGINDQFTKLSRSEAISHVVDMLKKGDKDVYSLITLFGLTEEEILEAVEQNEGVSTLCADPETGEVLTEEEMREFDGDIEEPDMNEIDSSAFDVEALAILDEIFGNELEVR